MSRGVKRAASREAANAKKGPHEPEASHSV
jgi:hypothetical protein